MGRGARTNEASNIWLHGGPGVLRMQRQRDGESSCMGNRKTIAGSSSQYNAGSAGLHASAASVIPRSHSWGTPAQPGSAHVSPVVNLTMLQSCLLTLTADVWTRSESPGTLAVCCCAPRGPAAFYPPRAQQGGRALLPVQEGCNRGSVGMAVLLLRLR